jgi:hypothetical protein
MSRLSDLANETQTPFPHLLTNFLLERAAMRLTADKKLASHLVFKGGYVGLRVHHSPRYTVDLDALAVNLPLKTAVDMARAAINVRELQDPVWFVFEDLVDLKTQGEYGGARLVFRAGIGEPLKNIKRAQIINIDFATGDAIVPGPIRESTRYLLGEGSLSWSVYPAETTVSEKLHAMITLGDANSRSKDIYDIGFLLPKCNAKTLGLAIANTFKSRNDDLPKNFIERIEAIDRTILKRGWRGAIGSLSTTLDFDTAFDKLVEGLKRIL